MYTIKIRKVGNSLGATFPKEVLAKLNVGEGDDLYITETADGVHLSPYNPEFAAAMEAFEVVRKQYRDAFRELAK